MVLVQFIWGINLWWSRSGFCICSRCSSSRCASLVALILMLSSALPRKHFETGDPLCSYLGRHAFHPHFTGMHYLDAATTSIAVQLWCPSAAIPAAVVFKETLHWRRITGMVIAFAGIVLIAGQPKFTANPWPFALGHIRGAGLVDRHMQVKALGDEIDAVSLNGWIAALAAPQPLLISYL